VSAEAKAAYYRNVRMIPFDLVKELALAIGGVLIVVMILAAVFSSPDVPAVTIANWAAADPVDFVTTATSELAGSSTSADYGPPNSTSLADAQANNGQVTVAAGDYGPAPVLMNSLVALARSGGLDGLLLASNQFFATDYTGSLLFMGDGGYLEGLANEQKLTGNQWGMMHETGRYPGQAWLWLYTLGYQVPPFNEERGFLGINSGNADLAITVTMGALTLLLVLVPFVPGLRDIPRWIPIHRLIWRRYYAEKGVGPRADDGTA
jgi:hypothetical protein